MSDTQSLPSTLELHWVCKRCGFVELSITEPKSCPDCHTYWACSCCDELIHSQGRPFDCHMCGAPGSELRAQGGGFDNAKELAK